MGVFPTLQGPVLPLMKPSSDQVLTVQAVRWLLATTSNRGDQISTAQFIGSLDKPTLANIFEEHDSWERLLSATVNAFEIWYSQPNQENQEVAELFGLALCQVLLQCPKDGEKWKEIAENSVPGSNDFGNAFLQNLLLASRKYSIVDPEDDRRILHLSFMFTAGKNRINVKEYQWTKSAYLLNSDSPAASALLCSWALLVFAVGTAIPGSSLHVGVTFTELLES
ncbi:hypothetical protein FRC01_001048, partial [Tulasnella sp. 417]